MSMSHKQRFEIFRRDRFTCQYCGRAAPDVELQIDHVKPQSKGGGDESRNLATCCSDCNAGKDTAELEQEELPPMLRLRHMTP